MNCLLDKERVIKYPCSPNCHLFGDCIVEFEKQNTSSSQSEDKVEKVYIEKEALRIAYEKSYQNDNHVVEGASAIHAQEHRHILHILDKQPAADVEVVKHGRWIDRYDGEYVNPLYECSECKESALYEYRVNNRGGYFTVQVLSAHCPHCGAKMALEEEV